MGMQAILHIASGEEWQAAVAAGEYRCPSLEDEGFIHCSRPDQILDVANSMFAGRGDLVLLVIEPERVPAEIRYEDCYDSGQTFPHVYGPLPLTAVVKVVEIQPGDDGRFGPADL